MMRAGIRWRLVDKDTDLLACLERPMYEADRAWPFTATEVNQLIASSEGTRYGPAIVLGLTAGLRGGEVWGLQWIDWNPDAATLRIDRQVVESKGALEVKPPKRSSNRTLLLCRTANDALFERQRVAMREGLAQCEWVFPQLNAKPTRRTNFSYRVWTPLLAALKFEHRGFHHARHTYATLSLNSGVPITVVRQSLGHKKVSTTLDTYAHCMTNDKERHRGAMDAVLKEVS